MPARIYKPARSAMQSGTGNSQEWVFEFEQATERQSDPLMGWTSSDDTATQVKLKFATREEAEAYATRKGIAYSVQVEPVTKLQKKSYSDNFKFGRNENWTH